MVKKVARAVLLICVISSMAGCFYNKYSYYNDYSYYAEEAKGRDLKVYIKQNDEINVDGVIYKPMQWSFKNRIYKGKLIGFVDDRDNEYWQTAIYDIKQFSDKSFLIYSFESDYGSGLCFSSVQRSDIALPEFRYENIDSIEWGKYEKVDREIGFAYTHKPTRDPEIIRRLFDELNDEENMFTLDTIDDKKIFNKTYEYVGYIFCYNDDWPDLVYNLRIWYNGRDCCINRSYIENGDDGWVYISLDLIKAINGNA